VPSFQKSLFPYPNLHFCFSSAVAFRGHVGFVMPAVLFLLHIGGFSKAFIQEDDNFLKRHAGTACQNGFEN